MRKRHTGPPTWNTENYIGWCDANSPKVNIRYAGNERWHVARLVHTYKRGDRDIQQGQVMSASSGPKDYFINDVISVFEQNYNVSEAAFLVLNGVPFLIVKIGPMWFDLVSKTGKGPAFISERMVEVIGDNATISGA